MGGDEATSLQGHAPHIFPYVGTRLDRCEQVHDAPALPALPIPLRRLPSRICSRLPHLRHRRIDGGPLFVRGRAHLLAIE